MARWYCVECGFENLDGGGKECELCQAAREGGVDKPEKNGEVPAAPRGEAPSEENPGEGAALLPPAAPEDPVPSNYQQGVPDTPGFEESGDPVPPKRTAEEETESFKSPRESEDWQDAVEPKALEFDEQPGKEKDDDEEVIVVRPSSLEKPQAETAYASLPGPAPAPPQPPPPQKRVSKAPLPAAQPAPAERPPSSVSVVSSFSAASEQGRRKTMEDVYMVNASIHDDPSRSYFAVFDGHAGSRAAEYCGQRMLDNVTATAAWRRGNVAEAIKYGIQRTEQSYLRAALSAAPKWFDGTTAVTCLIVDGVLTVGWVGDSRAVLGRYDSSKGWHALGLSTDHKPTAPSERDRIVACGGSIGRSVKEANASNVAAVAGARCPVFCFGAHPAAPMRCYPGGLSLSRSIGDVTLKYHSVKCVIGEPEIFQCRIDLRSDRFIVLGCDGIWDVITNDQAVNIVANAHSKKQDAAKALVKAASQAGSTDNMTVVVVKLINPAK